MTVVPRFHPAGFDAARAAARMREDGVGAMLLTSPENDGLTWSPLGSQEFHEGPFEMAFDATNGILYNASITAGMWALKTK